jgi:cyclophilin family peptidyl-prolyl cis-trans isomerase
MAPAYTPMAYIDTENGSIQIELAVVDARGPSRTSPRWSRRASSTTSHWHRVVADFVIQGGRSARRRRGRAGYTIRDEINQRPYVRGTVGMALDWADTGGSQFFITHSPQPHLDGRYTVFGQVVTGWTWWTRCSSGMRSAPSACGTASTGSAARALTRDRAGKKRGTQTASPFLICWQEALALLRLLGLLAAFFAFLRHRCIPPSGWVMRQGAAPPAVASAAWHSARGCRLPAPCCAPCSMMRAIAERWGSVDHRPW